VAVILIFWFLPLIFGNHRLYLSVAYDLLFIVLQLTIHTYYSSKKLIVTDVGIEEKFLWNLSLSITKWADIEEAHETTIQWLACLNPATTIKIIVTNDEPLYLKMQEIKNCPLLYQILRERIRFIGY
jgi:hypothetical protein